MNYFFLQCRRAVRFLPAAFLVTLLLGAALCLTVFVQLRTAPEDTSEQKFRIGVVGDTSETYLGMGISMLEHLDSSRFTCEFPSLGLSEAQKELESGELSAYVIVPDDFVESVVSGTNSKVTFVTGTAQAGLRELLVREMASSISRIITESQAGIYAMQEFYEAHGILSSLYADADRLNLLYFDLILSRTQLYEVETLNDDGAVPLSAYYLCAALLLYLLFFGIACSFLFIRNDWALPRLLSARGFGVFRQTAAECGACCMLMLLGLLGFAAFLTPVFVRMAPALDAPFSLEQAEVLPLAAGLLLAAALIGTMYFLLFELTSGLVAGTLLGFCISVFLGYLSGFFYPVSFFPEGVRRLAGFLPTGMLFSCLQNALTGKSALSPFLGAAAWLSVFWLLCCAVRKIKLSR